MSFLPTGLTLCETSVFQKRALVISEGDLIASKGIGGKEDKSKITYSSYDWGHFIEDQLESQFTQHPFSAGTKNLVAWLVYKPPFNRQSDSAEKTHMSQL